MKVENKSLVTLSVFWVLNVLGVFWLFYFDVLTFIHNSDITYISFLIIGIYLVTILSAPWELASEKPLVDKFENHMFISNHLPALGLLGTVMGLMFAVNVMAGIKLDVRDQASIMMLMTKMFTSLGTALVTTIVGLITSLLLKVQLIVLDTVHKYED